MKKKTAVLILLIVLLLAGAIVLFLTVFQKTGEETPAPTDSNTNPGQFFPVTPPVSETNQENIINTNENFRSYDSLPRLRQLFKNPTAGHVSFEKETETTKIIFEDETQTEILEKTQNTHFRFVERSTGHIYETTNKSLDLKRISNTSFPQTQTAFFSPNGEHVILQSLDLNTVKTYVAKILEPKEEETIGSLEGGFLTINAKNILPIDNNRFVYSFLVEDSKYLMNNLIKEATYTNPTQNTNIFSTPMEFISLSNVGNAINILTNPSFLSVGHYYKINQNNLEKIVGDREGLNVKENQKYVIYSFSDSINFPTNFIAKQTNQNKRLELNTLPKEKCVFDPKNLDIVYCAVPFMVERGNYPDNWYIGLVNFTDIIYKINLDTEQREIILDQTLLGTNSLDIIDIRISSESEFLTFINKNDLSLWSLEI
jgi:hypothetical protein